MVLLLNSKCFGIWQDCLLHLLCVETILDKENYTLEELLNEEEIMQECKALNGHLINFLRERA